MRQPGFIDVVLPLHSLMVLSDTTFLYVCCSCVFVLFCFSVVFLFCFVYTLFCFFLCFVYAFLFFWFLFSFFVCCTFVVYRFMYDWVGTYTNCEKNLHMRAYLHAYTFFFTIRQKNCAEEVKPPH